MHIPAGAGLECKNYPKIYLREVFAVKHNWNLFLCIQKRFFRFLYFIHASGMSFLYISIILYRLRVTISAQAYDAIVNFHNFSSCDTVDLKYKRNF